MNLEDEIERRIPVDDAFHGWDQWQIGYARGFSSACKKALERMRYHGIPEEQVEKIIEAMIEWNNAE